jgi:hypothetical protein
MLGLDLLDVLIGVVFVFLLVSLIASAVAEIVENWRKARSKMLMEGIKELLNDTSAGSAVAELYKHPLISSLYRGIDFKTAKDGNKLPSYIPARNFALALMDLALSSPAAAPTASGASGALAREPEPIVVPVGGAGPIPPPLVDAAAVTALRAVVANPTFDANVNCTLVLFADAAKNDAAKVRENIEAWYNTAMDRVSGWYKNQTQWFLFCIGLLIAAALNVDSIHIVQRLSSDKALRDATVAEAKAYVDKASKAQDNPPKTDTAKPDAAKPDAVKPDSPNPATSTDPLKTDTAEAAAQKSLINAKTELLSLGLPIGWSPDYCAVCKDTTNATSGHAPAKPFAQCVEGSVALCWLLRILGWLITALAVSLGAPFWFDMLNKIVVVRSTIKPDEKSGKEAKDPQKKGGQ